MSRTPDDTPEGLLEHLDWVHRLARRLTADSGLAEDAAQEAALALSQGPLAQGVNVRAWLGAVLKNRIRQGQRAAGRRRRHEAAAARPEGQPSALDLVARASVQRQVVDTVLGLREPYRTVVLLRYFEGLTPARIAAREGLPVETVKTRLKRGLASLREQLDAEHGGDGRTWAMVLMTHLPIHRGALAGAAAGASLVTLKHFIAPAVAAIAALATGWWLLSEPEAAGLHAGAGSPAASVEPELGEPEALAIEAGDVRVQRASAEAARTATPAAPAASSAAPMLRVEGRVVTTRSAPVADAEVRMQAYGGEPEQPATLSRTDAQGRFEFELEPVSGLLVVEAERWTTVLPGAVQSAGDLSLPTIVVAPPRTIEGRVVDAEGVGVAGAQVTYTSSNSLWGKLEVTVDRVGAVQFETLADSSGYFAFERVPELEHARLFASLDRISNASLEVPERGDLYEELTLSDVVPGDGVVTGRVIDAADAPVAGAWVSMGGESLRTAADGRFALSVDEELGGDTVRAVAAGFLPAEFRRTEGAAWPAEVLLRLGEPALSIAGRVLDDEGGAVPNVEVRLLGATTFGLMNRGTEADPTWTMASLEGVAAGLTGSLKVRTDAEGRFAFGGLRDVEYGLLAVDRSVLRTAHLDAVRAGAVGVELAFAMLEDLTRVAGRVVDGGGTPVARADVTLRRALSPAESGGAALDAASESVTTDESGRFAFEAVLEGDAWLHVYAGPTYPMRKIVLAEEPELDAIEVQVAGLAAFYVDLGAAPELADRAELLDADGEPTPLYQTQGLGMFSMQQIFVTDGRSPVVSAPEGTWELVLWKGDALVERREIRLAPGEAQAITF